MIKNTSALNDIREQWKAIRILTSRGPTGAQLDGEYVQFPTRDSRFYNLPFLLAYATLEQCLEELADEDTIPHPKGKPTLNTRMQVSRLHLSWQSFDIIDEGRKHRNALAHNATLLNKEECLDYIWAVEIELKQWGYCSVMTCNPGFGGADNKLMGRSDDFPDTPQTARYA